MKKLKFVSALILLWLGISSVKAQTCAYSITNKYNCTILVDVQWVDCTGVQCDLQTGVSVGATSTLPLACAAACGVWGVCDVVVTLTDVGSYTFPAGSQPWVSSGSTTASGSIPAGSCVPPAVNTYNMLWGSSVTTIGP